MTDNGCTCKSRVDCRSIMHQCTCLFFSFRSCKATNMHLCSCSITGASNCKSNESHQCTCYFNVAEDHDMVLRCHHRAYCRAAENHHKKLCICDYSDATLQICDAPVHICVCDVYDKTRTRLCRRHSTFEVFTLWQDTTSYFNQIPEEVLLEINSFYLLLF